MNGGFFPLDGFMDKITYHSVIHEMRLPDGSIWPIPIIFDIDHQTFDRIKTATKIALKNTEGTILAYLDISEIWQPEKSLEAELVYGTTSEEHPGVSFLFNQTGDYYVGGKITPIQLPKHYDFQEFRKTPEELKAHFKNQGYQRIVAFQTRNPLHKAHLALISNAVKGIDGHLLLHPTVGMTKPGDVDHFTRVKCYQKFLPYCNASVTLSLLPLSMRMAGPKEAIWHAIIRRNYGATHFIIGRDHAGPGKDSTGKDFYPPYAAQELANCLGIELSQEKLDYITKNLFGGAGTFRKGQIGSWKDFFSKEQLCLFNQKWGIFQKALGYSLYE